MSHRVFCTIKDLEGYEPNILDLAPKSGNLNDIMAAARKEIEDRLITSRIIENLDKLGDNVMPRQLRTPAIFKALEITFRSNALDEDSPYWRKAQDYKNDFDNAFGRITHLDLDSDEDGTLEENEENVRLTNFVRARRR